MKRRVTGTCIDYTHDGKGVLKIEGIPLFVENVIVGEEAEVLITKREKGYNLGRLIKLLSVSKNRCRPLCDNYKYCGGCHLQHMVYEEQLRFKQNRVQDVIKRIAGIEIEVPKIWEMQEPLRYRNKVQVPIGQTYDGKIIAGFFKKRSHQIIDMQECFIEDRDADELILLIKELVQKYKIEPCEIHEKRGFLRYAVVRKSFANQDLMVVFVTRNEIFPRKNALINELVERNPKVKTVVQNINPSRSSVVLGRREKILYGPGFIVDKICGLKFKISAHSFYQVNPVQTEVLYKKAVEFAELKGYETILDAYCGVGTIGLIAASRVKKVIGVELVKSAVDDAKENAKSNNITNAEFFNEDATKFILKAVRKKSKYDVIFLDPPRDGCSQEFIASILKLLPPKLIYVSCDPASLARDLKTLKQSYELKKIECVDMFPQTYHIETVVLLSKLNKKHVGDG